MSFEKRLIEIYKIINEFDSISKAELERKTRNRMAHDDNFIITDLNTLNEILEVDILLGRLKENEEKEITLTKNGKKWLKEQLQKQN